MKTTAKKLSSKESPTVFWMPPPSSETSENSSATVTPNNIREWLMSCLEDSPVPHFHQRPTDITVQKKTCGLRSKKPLESFIQLSFLGKMYQGKQLSKPLPTSMTWITVAPEYLCPRKTWVQTTFGRDIGYLHTPTTKPNYTAPSMQKWDCCRAFKMVFGSPTPTNMEWMMNFPIGWTDLKPLGMHKFQSWRQQHGESFQEINIVPDRRNEGK